jgi:peptidyl-prolyl cis-trans isomerase D
MAMMTWMRRSSRYFLAFVVLTFIASLAYFGATQERGNPATVAKVNGEDISATAYDRAYRATVEQYRQLLKDRFNDDLLRSLRVSDQVIERLVTDRLMAQRAAAEGIAVSDEELADEIVKIPAFQTDGRFARDQYQRVLARVGLTPTGFEQDLRAQLLQRKLQGVITDGVKVSEAELRQYWEGRQARVRAAYLVVSPDAFVPTVEATDADVEAYYTGHPAEFTRPERRRVLVATLPAASVAAPAVSDADVEAAYQERQKDFEQPERRKVAHLLFRVPSPRWRGSRRGPTSRWWPASSPRTSRPRRRAASSGWSPAAS